MPHEMRLRRHKVPKLLDYHNFTDDCENLRYRSLNADGLICIYIRKGGMTLMDVIFTICLLSGVIIPIISVILGLIDNIVNLFDGLDWDFDINIGDVSISLLPASGASICVFLLLFGSAGKLLLFLEINPWLVLSMAVLIGYVCSILVQNLLINRLKQIRMEPNKREEFIGRIGKVLITILPGTTGSVSFTTKTGRITYPAKTDGLESLQQGISVRAERFDGNILIVTKLKTEDEI